MICTNSQFFTEMLDQTHDPALRSWVETANEPGTDFPIQNLPFGVFTRPGNPPTPTVGVAIGDQVLDLVAAATGDAFSDMVAAIVRAAAAESSLNTLMSLGRDRVRAVRREISDVLRAGALSHTEWLVPMSEVEMRLPARVGDYSDFYASIHHATNVGSMFRPDNPLLPNYKWVPIGYHGRASSIVVSGTEVRRPLGQTRDGSESAPSVGPSTRLDYELEIGAFIGSGNALGETISIDRAERHVFGLCLLNDWSARDVQTWEYQPLGPFLAKSFATSVSPWVVTLDALEPYRIPAFGRAAGDPVPLPYLSSPENTTAGGFGITLEVLLSTERMRQSSASPVSISRGSFADMYWTVAQLVTHHAMNGCNLRSGDLLGSGTVSGATKESRGCLLERTWRGTEPLQLPNGETRTFLHDGDEIIMRGWCERAGRPRIGFGEVIGRIVAAHLAS
ncbi:MAG TPA: fumarylacetoacetase [Gemmatimonadaceae bacterium]|jgi:fumarylacetoacetase